MEIKEGLRLVKEKCSSGECVPGFDCPFYKGDCLFQGDAACDWDVDEMEKCFLVLKEQNRLRIDNTTLKQPCDMVNHPAHYTQGGIECIDAIKAAVTGLTGMEAVCTGNVIRYIWRWKFKNGLEDLKKCRWYIDKLIEEVEGAK